MPDTTPVCPKCRADMEAGFLVDHTYGGVEKPEWASGTPDLSFWMGVRLKGRERHAVHTYRCTSCGYLESYARGE